MTADFLLFADDLTGALDATAPLASRYGPAPVIWERKDALSAGVLTKGNLGIDAGTRNLSPAEAGARMARLARLFEPAPLTYLKVDSLMRGHIGAELAAVAAARAYASIIVAPAFPEHGRITLGAQQYLVGADGSKTPLGRNLADVAREVFALPGGLPVHAIPAGDTPRGAGVFVCDAVEQADLLRIAESVVDLDVLHVGSGGLSRALGGGNPELGLPPGRRLVIAGSGHPVTRRQIDQAAASPHIVHEVFVSGTETPRACDALLIEVDTRPCAAGTHLELLAVSLRAIDERLRRPDCLLVSGGDTFSTLLAILGAQDVTIAGEFAPGMPSGTVRGGAWDGVRFVSKSGAFGPPDLFIRFLKQPNFWTAS